jgi:hypothetical protein
MSDPEHNLRTRKKYKKRLPSTPETNQLSLQEKDTTSQWLPTN